MPKRIPQKTRQQIIHFKNGTSNQKREAMKSKHTRGEFNYCNSSIDPKKHNYAIIADGGTSLIADVYRKTNWNGKKMIEDNSQSEANAQLIADAFNVTNETNKTPRELQKSHDELLDALIESRVQIEYLHDKFKETGSGNGVLFNINRAIKNATK
jgi:hypothetical protein